MVAVVATISFTSIASVNPDDDPVCKKETGHFLAGYCSFNMEGKSVCVTSSNECDCCHSAD